jgi:hypothetical protein
LNTPNTERSQNTHWVLKEPMCQESEICVFQKTQMYFL